MRFFAAPSIFKALQHRKLIDCVDTELQFSISHYDVYEICMICAATIVLSAFNLTNNPAAQCIGV